MGAHREGGARRAGGRSGAALAWTSLHVPAHHPHRPAHHCTPPPSIVTRLLYHRVRPVFVFDVATPALKKRTTLARRHRREQHEVRLRAAAERLLMNQLRKHALVAGGGGGGSGVAAAAVGGDAAGGGALAEAVAGAEEAAGVQGADGSGATTAAAVIAAPAAASRSSAQEDADLARAIAMSLDPLGGGGDGGGGVAITPAPIAGLEDASAAVTLSSGSSASYEGSDNDVAGVVVPEVRWTGLGTGVGGIRGRGAGWGWGASGKVWCTGRVVVAWRGEAHVCVLLHALRPPTHPNPYISLQNGEFDPEVLSSLPPSVQLEVLARARDAATAANREKFAAAAAVPAAFSRLQMAEYVKSTQFRCEWGYVGREGAPEGDGGGGGGGGGGGLVAAREEGSRLPATLSHLPAIPSCPPATPPRLAAAPLRLPATPHRLLATPLPNASPLPGAASNRCAAPWARSQPVPVAPPPGASRLRPVASTCSPSTTMATRVAPARPGPPAAPTAAPTARQPPAPGFRPLPPQ